jgi:NitT/TauT family transport system ATP-binding protein
MRMAALQEAALRQDAPSKIQVRHVSKVFRSPRGDVAALDEVSLGIGEGEFVSLVGPSGCGKSTLLRCLCGLEKPTKGMVSLDGSELRGHPKKLGMVFQRDVLLDWRTVIENVLLPIEIRGGRPAEYRERAHELLTTYGLGSFEHRYPWELSGGMRQRVAICRAMIDDPALLLMDEPFAALDAFTRDELNLDLQRIWEASKKTVVFVTHSIPEAVFLSDRVVVMAARPGRIVEDIDVDLARPRPLSVRDTAQFGGYTARIRRVFEQLGMMRSNLS